MVATAVQRRPYGKTKNPDGTPIQCAAPGCEAPSKARGYCPLHYHRWYFGQEMEPRPRAVTACLVDLCEAVGPYTRGFCRLHYGRFIRFGDPLSVSNGLARRGPQPTRRFLPTASGAGELGKILGVSRQRADQLLNPDKRHARSTAQAALASGKIAKSPLCNRCLEPNGKLHAHHWDYSRPLEVSWYCDPCHRAVHVAMRTKGLRPYPRQTRARRLTNGAPPVDGERELAVAAPREGEVVYRTRVTE